MIYTILQYRVYYRPLTQASKSALPFPKQTSSLRTRAVPVLSSWISSPSGTEAAAEFLRWLNAAENNAHMCAVRLYACCYCRYGRSRIAGCLCVHSIVKTANELMQLGITSPQGKAKAACDSAINNYCKMISVRTRYFHRGYRQAGHR